MRVQLKNDLSNYNLMKDSGWNLIGSGDGTMIFENPKCKCSRDCYEINDRHTCGLMANDCPLKQLACKLSSDDLIYIVGANSFKQDRIIKLFSRNLDNMIVMQ
jgi:hypothetical protein